MGQTPPEPKREVIIPGYSNTDIPFRSVIDILSFHELIYEEFEVEDTDFTFKKDSPIFFGKILYGFFEMDRLRKIWLMFTSYRIFELEELKTFVPLMGTRFLSLWGHFNTEFNANNWLDDENLDNLKSLKGIELVSILTFNNDIFKLDILRKMRQLKLNECPTIIGGKDWARMNDLWLLKIDKLDETFKCNETFEKFQNVSDLSVSRTSSCNDSSFLKFKRLRHVSLWLLPYVSGKGLRHNSKTITSLSIYSLDTFSDAEILYLVNLESLEIRFIDSITGSNWRNLRKLKRLEVSDLRNLENKTFSKAMVSNLEVLKIKDCSSLTGSNWNEMPNLKILNILRQGDRNDERTWLSHEIFHVTSQSLKILKFAKVPGVDISKWPIMKNLEIFWQDIFETKKEKRKFWRRYRKLFPKLTRENFKYVSTISI